MDDSPSACEDSEYRHPASAWVARGLMLAALLAGLAYRQFGGALFALTVAFVAFMAGQMVGWLEYVRGRPRSR